MMNVRKILDTTKIYAGMGVSDRVVLTIKRLQCEDIIRLAPFTLTGSRTQRKNAPLEGKSQGCDVGTAVMTDTEALAAIQAQLNQANFVLAEKLCEEAVRNFDHNAQFHAYLGYACLQQGKPEVAIFHCDNAIARDDSCWFAYHIRSMSQRAVNKSAKPPNCDGLSKQGDQATFLQRLKIAIATNGSAAAYSTYAAAPAEVRIHLSVRELEEVIQLILGAAAVADVAVIRARLNTGDAAGAETFTRASMTRFADLAELYGLLAYSLHQQGQFKEAIVASAAATDLSPFDWLGLFTRGIALRSLGSVAEARAVFARAARAYPSDVNTCTHLLETTLATHGFKATHLVMDAMPTEAVKSFEPIWRTLLVENGEPDEPPAGTTALVAKIESAYDWAKRHGILVVHVGEIERVPFAQLPVWGGPKPEPPTFIDGYQQYAVLLPTATIASSSSLILTGDNCVLNDVGADPEFGQFASWTYDKRVLAQSGRTVMLDKAAYAAVEIEGGIMLSGLASDAFGHWIPEYLCRLPVLEQHPAFNELPIIVDAEMPASHIDYLKLVSDRPILALPPGGAFCCQRLLYAPPPSFFPVELVAGNTVPAERRGMLSPSALRILRERVLARLSPKSDAISEQPMRGRWFLGRRNMRWRRLSNEVEIATALQPLGFETVYPEDLTLAQQISLFRHANAIVAPNGSSLLNLIFAPMGLPTVVLAQRSAFNWGGFQGPMEALGYQPLWVCSADSSPGKHADYAIGPSSVIAALKFLGIQ